MRRRRLLVALTACGIGLALSACGVPIQQTATPITEGGNLAKVPKVLPPPEPHGQPINVFFLSNGHLVASTRYLKPGHLSREQQLQEALNALAAGPTTTELAAGATTALSQFPPTQPSLIGRIRSGTAIVDLDSSFGLLDDTELFESNAQIVYTLTQFPGIDNVSFVFGGVREAWLPFGNVRYGGYVNRSDYRAIRPLTSSG